MATLKSFRISFAKPLYLMRRIALGSQNIRLCHNHGDPNSKENTESEEAKKQPENEEGEGTQENSSETFSDEGLDDSMISDRILSAALQFVPEYGWTGDAIAEGARLEGLSGMASGLFPRQGGDLVLHFINTCNVDLGHYLADNSRTDEENRMKTSQTEFIKKAIEVRLRMVIPYIESWPQAMGLMAYPSNAIDAIQSGAYMTDDIWYHSNDASTDLRWYTKRASLAAIYGATELYMLQDKSEDFKDTWQFLDRRFENIQYTSNLKQQLTKATEDTTSLACSAITLAKNIAGFNRWNR